MIISQLFVWRGIMIKKVIELSFVICILYFDDINCKWSNAR